MTLEIEIRINGCFVAYANASNIGTCTGDAELSDYVIDGRTEPSPVTGLPAVVHEKVMLHRHKRAQSVWALVTKVAKELARRENEERAKAMTQKAIRAMAAAQFGADARQWFRKPCMWLDHARPIDLLKTAAGRRQLQTYLSQIEYGVYV